MTLKTLLAAFTAAVEKGDGNALADCFTADGVYDDYFFGPSKPGRDGIVEMLAHFYEGGKDFRWDFFDIAEAGSLGYASYRFSYTSTLPDAKGARVAFEGISRMTLAGRPDPALCRSLRSQYRVVAARFRARAPEEDRAQVREPAQGKPGHGASREGLTGIRSRLVAWCRSRGFPGMCAAQIS